jgi:nucleoside-diphosphate-sugar epimerase
LTQINFESTLLDHSKQFVIYGANGWMGRSATDYLSLFEPKIGREQILLIGSKRSHLEINNKIFEIHGPNEGFDLIKENAIFLNSAFIRREALQSMSSETYLTKNKEIIDFAKSTLKQKKLFSFINLSSGAARDLDGESKNKAVDDYSRLKKSLEIEFLDIGNQIGVPIVNCRIYSLTGRYLNEFKNLALSSFIKQAQNKNRIEVMSPTTKRTYVDAVNLAGVLFSIASQGKNVSLDSGGTLVTMLDLAQNVASALDKHDLEVVSGESESPDYFGDFEYFNQVASKLNHEIAGIQDQILNTLKAFN